MSRYKPYEIYPVENMVNKIYKHADLMSKSAPKLYRNKRARYYNLVQSLLDCASLYLKMLGCNAESLSVDDMSPDVISSSLELQYQLSAVQAELESSMADINDAQEIKDSDVMSNREILALFGNTLAINPEINYEYFEVYECANLISLWFNTRFSIPNPNFKYQITQLPIWIQSIILTYGKACESGTTQSFVNAFKSWCESVSMFSDNKWAVPYCVYAMQKKWGKTKYTLQAMMIYDLLLSKQYYPLTDVNLPLTLDTSFMVEGMRKYHPECSDMVRLRIPKRYEIIEIMHFHSIDGGII